MAKVIGSESKDEGNQCQPSLITLNAPNVSIVLHYNLRSRYNGKYLQGLNNILVRSSVDILNWSCEVV